MVTRRKEFVLSTDVADQLHKNYCLSLSSLFTDTNGSDNSIPMAYLTLDHQLQVHHSFRC